MKPSGLVCLYQITRECIDIMLILFNLGRVYYCQNINITYTSPENKIVQKSKSKPLLLSRSRNLLANHKFKIHSSVQMSWESFFFCLNVLTWNKSGNWQILPASFVQVGVKPYPPPPLSEGDFGWLRGIWRVNLDVKLVDAAHVETVRGSPAPDVYHMYHILNDN